MYSIGQFSKIMGISTKTLIWYDNIGLLKPDFVNEENGYRYYTSESVKKLANIQYFQSLDFSIDEIMHMSKGVIEDKLKDLQKKIEHIEFNLSFLEKLKEEDMDKKILTIYDIQKSKEHQARIQGKWTYALSTNSFVKAIELCPAFGKPTDMPKSLFFGEEQCGTDTKNLLYYSIDTINIKEKTFTFLLMNLDESLILFEKDDNNSQEYRPYFHVYRRLSNTPYTKKDMEKIMKKAEEQQIQKKEKIYKYNGHLDGVWKHIDNINASEISTYKEREDKKCFNILYPMYNEIIFNGTDVAVMPDGNDLVVGKKTYTKENSMMKLQYFPKPNSSYIENPILHIRQKIIERKVDGQTMLFVNFTGELDTDENTTVYVYKKIDTDLKVENVDNFNEIHIKIHYKDKEIVVNDTRYYKKADQNGAELIGEVPIDLVEELADFIVTEQTFHNLLKATSEKGFGYNRFFELYYKGKTYKMPLDPPANINNVLAEEVHKFAKDMYFNLLVLGDNI